MDQAVGNGVGMAAVRGFDPDRSLLVTTPSSLPVNRELPPTQNLRITSRIFGLRPDVLAAAGNSLLSLRRRLESPAAAPRHVVVELVPDHVAALLQVDEWLATSGSATRVLVAGSATGYWGEYLTHRASTIDVLAPGNLVSQLTGVALEDVDGYLSPTLDELGRYPLWEKRRYAVGYGCPAACELCPRKRDQGTAGKLPTPTAVLDEVSERVARFGVRDVEIVGTAWAGEPGWAEAFLVERIRRGLEIRLRLAVTIDQLRESLVELLVPGGCKHITVRWGREPFAVPPGVTRRLKDLEGWGRILLLAPVAPLVERTGAAATRIAAAGRAVRAAAVHVVFHGEVDQPVACSELGRIVDGAGQLGFHLGITQRGDEAVLAWARELRDALVNAPGGTD